MPRFSESFKPFHRHYRVPLNPKEVQGTPCCDTRFPNLVALLNLLTIKFNKELKGSSRARYFKLERNCFRTVIKCYTSVSLIFRVVFGK